MTDFKNGQELLEVCKKKQCSISEVMKQREIEGTSSTKKEVEDKMRKALAIMKEAVRKPLEDPKPSMSGLIGGEAKQITGYRESGTNVCGTFMNKLIAYSMAVLEVNASMGVIVAAPTAGSCGIIPAVFIAYEQYYKVNEDSIIKALFTASGIGEIVAENASISGAQGGCQAEIGTAAAMAAGGVAYLEGGNGECIANAAALALKNMLGLVCDPVAGLVEVPCIKRNAIGAVNAITAAQMALAGIKSVIPADEVIDAMFQIGCSLPACLRETSQAGLAATPTALKIEKKLRSKGTLY